MNQTEIAKEISETNAHLERLLGHTRQSLRGESSFGVEQVRALSALISEMPPRMARSQELRASDPAIAAAIDRYKSNLGELHLALQQMHMMLLSRRSQMESGRVQLDAVRQWAGALSHTR
jgi:hypothetical protein